MTSSTTARRIYSSFGGSTGSISPEISHKRQTISGQYVQSHNSVNLNGRIIQGMGGLPEVVVSIDQNEFKKAMAVRDINGRVERKSSSNLSTKISISTD